MPPVTVGADQVYVVPPGTISVPLTGVTLKLPPLQIVCVCAAMVGTGLTVTVTVKVEPVQLPDVGVTVYVAVCAVLVGLVSVPVILAWLVPAAPPVMPPVTVGADHVYVVPPGTISVPFTGVTLKLPPLQMICACAAMVGVGLTVTVTVKVEPVQLPDVGVTV